MASGAVKARDRAVFALADGVDGLVSVALHALRAQDALSAYLGAAYAAKRVVHAVELHLQLCGVAHVHEIAASAAAEVGAVRLDTLGRCGEALLPSAVNRGLSDLHDAHAPSLSRQSAGHEHGTSIYPAHTRAL